MRLLASNRPRLIATLILVFLVSLLGLGLRSPNSPFGDGLVKGSYDSLHWFSNALLQNAPSNWPVVIVYLDLHSFISKHQEPPMWPRAFHAQLLQRLKPAKPRAVVFDIVFSAAGPDSVADSALANAIHDGPPVVLAADFSEKVTHQTSDDLIWTRQLTLTPPYTLFAQQAAGWGIAQQIPDDDLVVRQYLGGFPSGPLPSLTWATATLLQFAPTRPASAMQSANEYWVRYYGPALTIPHVSYIEALEPGAVPDEFFRDKIVFIGARPLTGLFDQPKDQFRNPFHSWGNKEWFMPGVEVYATEMLNLLRNDWLRRFHGAQEALLLLLSGFVFSATLIWLRPIPAALTAIAGAAICLALALFGFSRGLWFPWLIVSAAQVPAALAGSVLYNSLEWYRARRRLEAAKREADAKIREQAALIDKAHDAILVQALDGRVLYANPSAERLYGFTLTQLQNNGAARDIFLPDATAAAGAREAALARGEWNGELRQQTASGQIITVSSRWTLIRDDSGQPQALLVINGDITKKKQLEAQFLRTQRMNTIGSLAGGMAHDLNNALAPVLMGVQLLRRKSNDEETKKVLGLMETNTYRSADMVRQVLLFARGRDGEFESLRLASVVKELEKMINETFPRNIIAETFLPEDLWLVRGNATQIHQVLLNLCVNARDAMPNGGQLSLAADNIQLNAVDVADLPGGKPGEYVSLIVSDTGTGMPPEVRAKIFDPFFTTKGVGRGTGIGLSTVTRIVKNHGGFLRVESELGHGTTFEIFLPRASEAKPAATAELPTALPRGNGECILLADDEQAIRELVADGLRSQGYTILTASDGQHALALFRQNQSKVRLVLTDGAMPVMDGLTQIKEIQKLASDLPVVLASGDESRENTDLPGTVALLRKPFSLEEVLMTVHRILHGAAKKQLE
jgi:PAS domain S-box-containing protein